MAQPAEGHIVVYGLERGVDVRRSAALLGFVAGEARTVRVGVPRAGRVSVEEVEAWAVPLRAALPVLLALPPYLEGAGLGGIARSRQVGAGLARRQPSASAAVWALAARLAVRLVASHRLAPTLMQTEDGQVHGIWRVLLDDAEAEGLLAQMAAAMPPAAHALVREMPPEPPREPGVRGGPPREPGVRGGPPREPGVRGSPPREPGVRGGPPREPGAGPEVRVWQPAVLLHALLDAVADLAARDGGPPPTGRPRARLLPWTARWLEALSDPEDPVVPLREDAAELVASIGGWFTGAGEDGGAGTTELQLVAPDRQDGRWRLDFGVRTPDGELHPAERVWSAHNGDPEAVALQETLLHGLGRCARLFAPIDRVLTEAAPERLSLDLDEAWELLSQTAPLLTGVGVVVRLPGDLVAHRLRPRIRVGTPAIAPVDGPSDPEASFDAEVALSLGLRSAPGEGGRHGSLGGLLTGLRWEIALGCETLSMEEFEAIVAAGSPLVRWRDRWIQVDPGTVERIGALGEDGQVSLAEAVALSLEGDAAAPGLGASGSPEPGAPDGPDLVEVVADGEIALLLDRIRGAAEHPPAAITPDGFAGRLRPYQRRGVAWLAGMGELGLGAVLADDMGLGKTIQLIAHLLQRRLPADDAVGAGPFLIVCPTSVVGNWEREVRRFAPLLPVSRHHGAERVRELGQPSGAVLTTYGTLRRDVELFAEIGWDVVALDEAQHVKNPTTAAARAVRRLRTRQMVALTGTPLENRLAELWSVLDATNPGLLGTRTSFGRRFVAPIEKRRDSAAATRLRRVVAPFVLRRSKSDPAVIADLPDKIERTVVCPLTAEQAALYRLAVDRALPLLSEAAGGRDGSPGMERRGRILALLTELKQICNHPAQYLGEVDAQLTGRAGKLAAAQEIVAEATDAGDRLLVFTQFVVMGRLLSAQLAADLGIEVPFLHGGVNAVARDAMVDRFQSDPDASPVLIVSLRAGGTGLNLTAATHVIHYDRWWNPAVEDQATDRAHRIGQTRTVEVHKLVTAGTLEERIAELLERKRALADAVVGAGETWITELDDEALAELVALSGDVSIVDLSEDLAEDEDARTATVGGSW